MNKQINFNRELPLSSCKTKIKGENKGKIQDRKSDASLKSWRPRRHYFYEIGNHEKKRKNSESSVEVRESENISPNISTSEKRKTPNSKSVAHLEEAKQKKKSKKHKTNESLIDICKTKIFTSGDPTKLKSISSKEGHEVFKKKQKKRKCEDKADTDNSLVDKTLRDSFESSLEKHKKRHKNRDTLVSTSEKSNSSESNSKSNLCLEDELEEAKDYCHRLKRLCVILPWPAHQIHLIETRVAGRPTRGQQQQIKDLNIKLKTGIYSQAEDAIIKKNWKKFCKFHQLDQDPKPFLNFGVGKGPAVIPVPERIKFAQFLAHNLENRLLCSVYKRFRRLFLKEQLKTGRFTSEEDKIITEYLKSSKSKRPYADLAKILNRDKVAIEKRCKKLTDMMKGNHSSIKWNNAFIEEFFKHLLDVTKVDNVKELEHRRILTKEWKEIANQMNVPLDKLQRGWFCTVYPRTFVKRPVKSKVVKELLIDFLIKNKQTDWRNVDWEQVAKEFDGFNGQFLNKMLKETVRYHVPKSKHNDLTECLDYLKNVVIPNRGLYGSKVRRLDIVDNRHLDS